MIHEQLFLLADVLTILTGCLLCPIERVYRILNFLTGADIYTHQIPAALDKVRPFLVQRYPLLSPTHLAPALTILDVQLSSVDDASQRAEICAAWIAAQTVQLGTQVLLTPLPDLAADFAAPLGDLVESVGAEKVILFEPDDQHPPERRNCDAL